MSRIDPTFADRIVPLSGGQNFREVGGYLTDDGRRLRRRRLWRSARLDELTAGDVDTILGLGIVAVADLRRFGERASNPTHERVARAADILTWSGNRPREDMEAHGLFARGRDSEHYHNAVIDLYRMIVLEHEVHFRGLYEAIAGGALPILIHCAAGKDRTGLAIGILLELLGVRRDHILADYAKTEELIDWDRLSAKAALGGADGHWINRLDPVALSSVYRSDPRYLTAAFENMERDHGSVTNFAIDRLGLTPRLIDDLRDRLLEG